MADDRPLTQVEAPRSAIDVEKVKRLRAAIEAGTFRVDARRIAERLVDEIFSPAPRRQS